MREHTTDCYCKFAVRVESVSDQNTLVLPDGSTTSAPISPGVLAVADADNVLFEPGAAAGHTGLQQLAEDGDPCRLINHLTKELGIKTVEFLIPNLHYRVIAKPGDKLHFAVMFVQSNDLFYAFYPRGLSLFDERRPVSGDMTRYVDLWDAGTEVNQAPGVGPDQAPRQPFPGAGTKEKEPVKLVSEVRDGFSYPTTAKVIRVTITPEE
jgi:hypothetical protein